MSARTTGLFFGLRPDAAAAAKHAAEMLRARGYAVTERMLNGYAVSTNAPYKVGIDVKRRVWGAISEAQQGAHAEQGAASASVTR